MRDRVVLITGASGGLGTVTAAFLAAGATVAGVARSFEPSEFPSERFTAMPADLLSGDAAQNVVDATIERFQKIDVAVHLMGGFAGGAMVDETDEATFRPYVWDEPEVRILRCASRASTNAQGGLWAVPRGRQPNGRRATTECRRLQRVKGRAGLAGEDDCARE